MERLSAAYGRLLSALALSGCAMLFAMMMVIVADVLVRNVRIIPGVHGLSWANEVTEYALYLITLVIAPWLLRRGQHIRVDIVLRVIPRRLAWYSEWLCDLAAFICCAVMAFAGWKATASSMMIGIMAIKTLVLPEWWLLAPLQICFTLLAIEMLFRMTRLYSSERGAREDAVTLA
jgi:TRAP-type C4-dicarboxylate transport system permease small subunit